MTGGNAFLTEVSVGDEFAPPPHTGVKLRNLGVGEKQLIFPEVRPRVFEAYTPGHRMFGAPAYTGRKACPQFAKALNRDRNLIRRDGMIIPPEIALADSETSSRKDAESQCGCPTPEKEPTAVHMPPISPSRSSVFSSLTASSFCSTCASSCCGASEAASCSTCAEAARLRRQQRAERRGPCGGSSVASSVPPSAYDNLTSVSQQRSHTTSHRSGGSSSSAALVAQLQEQLEQERKQREVADQKLQELQRKQLELEAKLGNSRNRERKS
eukprot:GGOE01007477.1.p1 GENE.GGOE01007477.1~~GGOE01007477.1.p1  ORF type:complete len:269 (-),score=25.57 GGOE01007477.1:226-1032(-)